jgi:hypothetical protein
MFQHTIRSVKQHWHYSLKLSIMLGQQLVCKFEYNILDGLSDCLQKAADAVELSDWVEYVIMDDSKGG